MEEDHAINATKKAILPVNAQMLILEIPVVVVDVEDMVVAVVVAAEEAAVAAINVTSLDILLVNVLKKVNLVVAAVDTITVIVTKVVILANLVAVTIVEILIISLVIAINHVIWIMSSATIVKDLDI